MTTQLLHAIGNPAVEGGVEYVPFTDAETTEWEARQADDAASAQAAEQAGVARAWKALRMQRDRWLAQTDPFMLQTFPVDFPAAKASDVQNNLDAWKAFRQALRDLPGNTTDPTAITWPTPPAAPVVNLT